MPKWPRRLGSGRRVGHAWEGMGTGGECSGAITAGEVEALRARLRRSTWSERHEALGVLRSWRGRSLGPAAAGAVLRAATVGYPWVAGADRGAGRAPGGAPVGRAVRGAPGRGRACLRAVRRAGPSGPVAPPGPEGRRRVRRRPRQPHGPRRPVGPPPGAHHRPAGPDPRCPGGTAPGRAARDRRVAPGLVAAGRPAPGRHGAARPARHRGLGGGGRGARAAGVGAGRHLRPGHPRPRRPGRPQPGRPQPGRPQPGGASPPRGAAAVVRTPARRRGRGGAPAGAVIGGSPRRRARRGLPGPSRCRRAGRTAVAARPRPGGRGASCSMAWAPSGVTSPSPRSTCTSWLSPRPS